MHTDFNQIALLANFPIPVPDISIEDRGVPFAELQLQSLPKDIPGSDRKVQLQELTHLSNKPDELSTQGSYRNVVRFTKRYENEKDILDNSPISKSDNTSYAVPASIKAISWTQVWFAQVSEQRKQEQLIEQLGMAAKSGDERTFLNLLKGTNWNSLSVETYIKIIKLSFEVGAILAARNVSERGLACYPDDAEIKKYAHILAPPKVTANNLPMNPGIKANRNWLRANSDDYRGRWVALRDGELLESAESLEEVMNKLPDTENVMFTPIY